MKTRAVLRLSIVLCLLSLNLLVLPVEIFAQEPKSISERFAAFDRFYEQTLKQAGIVGSSVIVVHGNQIMNRDFYGLAKIDEKRKVDEDTIYHWASITKTFTGIAIMQLRDRGLLKLDDPVIKYIPELRQVHDPYGDMSEITIRHLMSHSAGFRDPTWPWKEEDKSWQPHEPQRWEQLVAMFPYTEILFKPGSKYSYSNPGIIFLGRIIELLTLDDYEVYIDKNILKPLEMHRTYFDTTPYHLLKYLAQSYFLMEGKLTPARWNLNTGITVSNGGLNAPLTDMIKYLNFLMGDPRNQAVYDQVLKRSSLAEMWQPQLEVSTGEKDKVSIGLNFFVEEHNGMRFIAHSGEQNAFISHFYVNQDSRTASVVAYNTAISGEETRAVDEQISQFLFANVFPIFTNKESRPFAK
jgi:CubicO group peptidase (beta-lactamase class C family)